MLNSLNYITLPLLNYIEFMNFQIYTDESHLLNGGNTRTHLYNSMEDFILNCYGKSRRHEAVEEQVEKDDEEAEER